VYIFGSPSLIADFEIFWLKNQKLLFFENGGGGFWATK